MRGRTIDLSGPEGNVFAIAGLAQSWNRQLKKPGRGCLLEATTKRLGATGDYNDALDTFDKWFKGFVEYTFINDPRNPEPEEE